MTGVQTCALPIYALGIPAMGKQPGPAWLYVQWACGKTMMARQLAGGFGAPRPAGRCGGVGGGATSAVASPATARRAKARMATADQARGRSEIIRAGFRAEARRALRRCMAGRCDRIVAARSRRAGSPARGPARVAKPAPGEEAANPQCIEL